MKEILEPLSQLPGVRVAALITHDGVPVALPGVEAAELARTEGRREGAPYSDADALAALSAGLLDELARGIALLSGPAPRRVVLKGARGTLIMLQTSGAVLLVVLKAGLAPEELRLPMEGAAARIQRVLRGMGGLASVPDPSPPSALPKREADPVETNEPKG